MKLTKYMICLGMSVCIAACSQENVFQASPTQRAEAQVAELRKELTEAPFGWKVIYFPQTDSLLFSDPNEKIGEFDYQPKNFSYGGKYFLMKFMDDGRVEMLSEENRKEVETPVIGEYEVDLNSMVQLSFTTYNYIHTLVNEAFGGSGDFLYAGKDAWGRMLFKTASYLDPAREYIWFEPLKEDPEASGVLRKSFENRTFFENLKNPQIKITKGDRVFFQSDRYLKYHAGMDAIGEWEKGSREHRYYVFLYNKKLNPVPDSYPLEVNGLGSGYVGTEDGIWFRSGIRYNKEVVFYNFYREGNQFVSELVRIYDEVSRKFVYADKRRYPDGEFTGYRAVIEEVKIDR